MFPSRHVVFVLSALAMAAVATTRSLVRPTVSSADPAVSHADGRVRYRSALFTGTLETRDAAGRVRERAGVHDGLLDGEQARWHADGRPAESRTWRSGGLEIEVLEDVQNLRDMDATGTRRRQPHDLIAAIHGAELLPRAHGVLPEVRLCHDAAIRLHPGGDRLRVRSMIKPVAPVLCDRAIAFREIGLLEHVAAFQHRAVGLEKGRLR